MAASYGAFFCFFNSVCCLVVVSETIRPSFIVTARYGAFFLSNLVCCLIVVSENSRLGFIVAARYGAFFV